jgi:magnesium chelatase family protein
MNPCRCGHFGNAARECGRAPRCAETYQAKISGPLMDRIDLIVEVYPISPSELSRAPPGEPSAAVAARVVAARALQQARAGQESGWLNSEAEIDSIRLEAEARAYAETAADKLELSARGFTRMLRVARSIADLAGVPVVRRMDIAEALAYRHRRPGQPVLRRSPGEKRIA